MSDLSDMASNSILLDFSPSKHPYLMSHVVSGTRPTLSAATLLHSLLNNRDVTQLHQITFLSTVQLEKRTQLKLVEDEDLLNLISIDETVVLTAKTKKSTSSVDNVKDELMSPTNFPLHAAEIDLVLNEKFYNFMTSVGYQHAKEFLAVHWLELRVEDGKAYGTVVLTPSPYFDCQLDALWQTMVFALLSTRNDSSVDLLVPFCIRSLKSKKLQTASNWTCSGRFVVNLGENYGNFLLFDGQTNEVLMIGEEIIFLPKSPDEAQIEDGKDQEAVAQEIEKEKIEKMKEENANKMAADLSRIGVRSMSCRLPGNVKSPEDFWELLKLGRSTDQRIPAERIKTRNELIRGQLYGNPIEGGNFLDEDVALFDTALFGLSQNEANAADPQQRLVLTCTYECLEKAGLITNDKEKLRKLGIFVGMMGTEYCLEEVKADALLMLRNSASIMCGQISSFFDSRGTSIVVDTACSSSLVALDMARSHLLDGKIDKALVIGVNLILSERAMGQRANGKLLSVDGRCKSFDRQADGYGRADGCVALLVESVREGRQYEAIIESTSTNHDGKSAALTVPNGTSHVELIRKCIGDVKNLDKKSIAFWECHGDPIELNALQKALTKYSTNLSETVVVSTAKATIGHTEAASGLVGVLKSVLQLKHAQVYPLPNFRTLNPQIQLSSNFKIPTQTVNLSTTSILCCGVCSFGVGGTNACAILSKADKISYPKQAKPAFTILPISAKTKRSLQQTVEKINLLPFDDFLAPAFALHRRHYTHRTAFIRQHNALKEVNFNEAPIRLELSRFKWTPFLKKTPQYNYLYDELSGNAQIDVIVLLKFLKEVGINRKMFEKNCSTSETILDLVYSNSCNSKQLNSQQQFGINFKIHNKTTPINSIRTLEEFIACLYVSSKLCEINWPFIYPIDDKNFLLEVAKKLPIYSFDNVVCWKTEREVPVFDHQIFGNLVEKSDDGRSKFENYLNKNRLSEFFKQKYFTIGFVVEGLVAILQHLRPNSIAQIQKWQFNEHVFVRQMWVFTELELDSNENWRFHFLTDGQTICKANGSFCHDQGDGTQAELMPITVSLREPERFVNFAEHKNFYSTKTALSIDNIIKANNFKPTKLKVLNLSGYTTNEFEIKFYDDQHQLCAEFNLSIKKAAKKPKEVKEKKEEAIQPKEEQKQDDLRKRISQILQLSTANDLELNESYYDVGFFDLGLDSLAMIGFANQLLEAQFPRLTSNELITHSTINKLAAYIRQKTGLLSANESTQHCDSGYSSVLTEDSCMEHKNSDSTEQSIDLHQLIYHVSNKKQEEERCKFRVAFVVKRQSSSIFWRFGNKRSELTFNALSTRIAETKPNRIELSFKMPNEFIDFDQMNVSKLFLKLGNALISSDQVIEIHVKAADNLISTMAMSFLKSLCAEHPTNLSFCFHERLQLIGREVKCEEHRVVSSVWIITGGTSGIGWQLGKHLLQKYSSTAILIARRPPLDEVKREIDQFDGRVQIMLADVSSKQQVMAVFKQIARQHKSVSIIHSAGVANDVLLQAQDVQRFSRVFDAKCQGLLNLKYAIEQYEIEVDNWFLNSSVSSVLGNVGQSNYAAANAFLDSFAHQHPNVCSINWANWLEYGFAATSSITDVLRKKGFYGLKTTEALRCFDWILEHPSITQIVVARVDWHQMFKFRPAIQDVVIQENKEGEDLLQRELTFKLTALEKTNNQSDFSDIQQIEEVLETEIKKLMKLDANKTIEKTVGFMELGLDSFGMFNLSNQINRVFAQNSINIIHLFEHSTIETLSAFIQQKLLKSDGNIIQHSNDQPTQNPTSSNDQQQEAKQSNRSEKPEKETEKQEKTSSKLTEKVKASVSFSKPLKKPNLLFLFGGHGTLYPSVCADLCAKVPFVEQQVTICSQHFQEHLKVSIANIIKQSKTDEIKSLPTEHAIIFTIGYSLAKFWINVDLEPTHLVGHSLGEIIAVCIAGRLELNDAAYLVYLRAKALEKCKGKGSMMAVDARFLPDVDQFGLSVAAINGPKQVVVSGPVKQIEKAKTEATKCKLSTKIISEEYAFHSKLVKDKHLKQLQHFNWSHVQNRPQNEMKVISNVNAEPLIDFNRHYVKKQATSTVQFWKSIENLLTEGEITVLEVGPGRVLSSLIQKILNEHSLRYLVLNTIQKDQENELDTLKWSAQKLELKGFSINQREFSCAIGEDFVEQVSNAFNSSFRLAKTGSLNAKHHRVTYQRRLANPNSGRQSSAANLDGHPIKQVENNKQLILHRREVELDELDLTIISDHRLFDETIAPAAFQFKCFSEHLRLQQIHLRDVRLMNKLFIDSLDSLSTVFDQGRLQLKQSGGEEKLFSSCLVEVVPEATATNVKLSQDQAESMQSPSVPAELGLCVGQEKKRRRPVVEQSDDAPDFPDSDPGIWISPRKFYEGMSASGFHYDKHLRLLLDIRLIGLNRIRTRCQKPAASWILFDLALQTLSAGLFDVRSTKCYVPVSIDEVYSNFPSDWTADGQGQWTFHGEVTKREGELVEGSVWIFARGVMIGHLKGIRAVRSLPNPADIVARRDRRNAISTDDEFYESADGLDKKKKRRKSRSQHGHKKPKEVAPEQQQTKHASFSSAASEFFDASRKSSSTVSKISLAVSTLKKTRLQRDFPLRLQSRLKMKDLDELLLVVRGSFGQFATDELHPFFESISQQSHTHNVFMLEQRKTEMDAAFFGLTPKEAQFIDPNQRFLLEATQRCIESAGLKQLPSNCGVFIGSSSSDFAQKAFAELDDPNAYLMAGTNTSTLSGRLAHFFQVNGPCLTVDTACSSFHTALTVACEFLSQRTCDWALVGASSLILNEKTTRVMQNSGMLSPSSRCATFDADADGFVRSEGYGVILVEAVPKTKSHMLRSDSVIIKGWSVGHTGGRGAGFLVPDPNAEASTMLEACQHSDVDLIECHGTGTALGDPIEVEAVRRFLRTTGQTTKQIYLNSMKTHFGHCEAAAGLLSFLSMLEVMKYGKLPPLRHFNKLSPNIQLFDNMCLPVETIEGEFRRILINRLFKNFSRFARKPRELFEQPINSFGFTGTNSSVLLEKYNPFGNKKLNFNRAPLNKMPKAVFNRQYLWPFNDEIKRVECQLLKYQLEFEETGFTLNQLAERAKTILYCGRKFTKQSMSIGRLKPAIIRELSEENLILIWSINKKKLIEQCAKVCRFMAHLKSNSYIDVVAPMLYAPTVLALVRTCVAERNFKNMRFYAVDGLQLVLPKTKIDSFISENSSITFGKCLVTGGLGGIGRKLLEQLPAKQKLIIGRTSRELVDSKLPHNYKYWNCDVAERTQLERLFRSEPKIDLVLHCAGVVQNALLKNQDAKHFEQVFSAKVLGTKNLLKLCRQYGVKKLIVLSSIAAIYGSVGQANYGVANAEMSRLVEAEQAVECLSIVLGPIGDAGMLSDPDKQPIRQQIEAGGWQMMSVNEVIKNILSVLNQQGQFILASGSKLHKDNPQKQDSVKTERRGTYIDKSSIQTEVKKLLNEISGLNEVPADRGFMSLGVDSLMIENLRSRLCRHFGTEVTPSEIYEHTTLNHLSEFLKKKLELKCPTDGLLSADESSSTTSESLLIVQEEESPKVAIVGLSGQMPNSDDHDQFFQQLIEGKELFEEVDQRLGFVNVSSCLKNVNQFDFNFFDLSEEDAALLDPQIKVLLKIAHTALEDAGYTQNRRRELKIACFTAAEPSEFENDACFAQGSLHGMYAKNQKDFVAAWISHLLGLRGPTNAVYSACSSSLVALANAVQVLRTNSDIGLCLVGGINLVKEVGHQIEEGSPMSKEPHSRPFSKLANGIIRGSACGVVLLKRLKDALNDGDSVLATIKEIVVNNDANRLKSNFVAPSIEGQQEVMEECLKSIEGLTLDYIECHATGTLVGDAIEIKALQNALQTLKIQSKPVVGSLKANIGHAFAASGMASLAKCLRILETRQIPPQINVKKENLIDEIDQERLEINTTAVDLPKNREPLRLMINNFGIGGTNGCLILEEFEQNEKEVKIETKKQVENFCLLVLSAKSKTSCIASCHNLADYLIAHPTTDLTALSNTLLNYRDHYEYRFATIVRNLNDAISQLKNVDELEVKKAQSDRPFALYFGHQGLQYPKMLEVERQNCGEFNKLYSTFVGKLDESQLGNPSVDSSFLFGIFKSVLEFLRQNGIHQPEAVFGHSLGEYGAMMTSDVLNFNEGLNFVTRRGKLFEKTKSAKMFAVQTDQNEIHEHLYLSAVLSSTLRSFVCAQEMTDTVKEDLNKMGLQWKELRSDYGFHSSFMDPILPEFFELASKLQLNGDFKVPLISNMDGEVIMNKEALTPDYLTQHLRQPVRMDLTLETLKGKFPEIDTIIEVGPSGILASLLSPAKWNHIQTVQSFSQHRHQPAPFLFQTFAKLWELGFSMNVRNLFGSSNAILRGLPVYSFDVYQFKWPTRVKKEKKDFQLYHAIWKYCKQWKEEAKNGKLANLEKKVWLFADLPSTFSTKFPNVFDIKANNINFNAAPEVILHVCLKPNRENTFHFLHSLKRIKWTQKTTLISCGLFNDSLNALSLGPLDELNQTGVDAFHILFDDLSTMKSTIEDNLGQLIDLKASTISRFRCINNLLLQLDYIGEIEKQVVPNGDQVYLLVGGSGSLGRALIDYLNETNSSATLINISRVSPKISPNVHHFGADITDRQALNEQLAEIKKKFNKIDCTLFLAGLKPSLQNNKEDIDAVLSCKVDGLRNLIKNAKNLNFSLGSLVLCSSLSAVNGLLKVGDYCSANCFLDQQALLPLSVAQNVLSVQLPPLRSTQMLGNESSILQENAIDLKEVARCLVEMRELNGVYALANENPLQIRQFLRATSVNDQTANNEVPRSTSERLVKIWKSLLPGLSSTIQPNDEFFALGGNSLSALQLTWRIQEEFQAHVSMDKLMRNAKFSQLLALIEKTSTKTVKIQRSNRTRSRLSLAQEQMWILGQMSAPCTYNVVFKLKFFGNFDEIRAFNALKLLMERQKVLRSRFFEENGEAVQELMPTEEALNLTFIDQKERPIEAIIEQELRHEFDLSKTAFRFILIKNNEQYFVLVNQQHIITDGFSVTIFAEEFSHFYCNQSNHKLPALDVDYLDYAEYSRREFDEQKCQEYANFLKQLPPQGTILWPSSQKSEGNSQLEVFFDSQTIEELDFLCKEFSCTRFLLIFSAFIKCVDQWRWKLAAEDEPIVVGCPSSGRNVAEVAKLIGYFLNNMVIRVDTRKNLQKMGLSELLNLIGDGINQAHKYADVPFHLAVARLNQSRNTVDHQPVFQLFFNYRHQLDFPTINLGPDLDCTAEQLTNNNAFQLACTVDELDTKTMKITLDYDRRSLSQIDVQSFALDLQKTVQKLRHINQVDYTFVYQPVEDFIGPFKSVIEMIFEQCDMRPNSPALQTPNNEVIIYRELKTKILRNSACLIEKFGCTPKPDTIVPILLDMNSAVEWILAVLACNLAYCPMDPNQPLMRTQIMVNELGSSFVVSDRLVDGLETLSISNTDRNFKNVEFESVATQIQPSQLAYSIFTSGSTGDPKAVCIEHGQLFNFVQRSRQQFSVHEKSRIAHSVNTVFDVSIFNIFATLTSGGCLVQQEEILDFVSSKTSLTHLILSSAIFNALHKDQLLSLKDTAEWVIVGGETPSDEALKLAVANSQLKISQFYGPTETTVWCTVNHYENGQFNGKNIGTACQPFFLTTLDSELPTPLECDCRAVGELWICGDQVGRGYLDQVNEAFAEDYMGLIKKAYRTGDLVRLIDNQLEFLGRRDHQFKVNGMRIDPQEIVAIIQKVGNIQQVCVSLINQQLIAFAASPIENEDNLKSTLMKHLPRYMIPTRLIHLDSGFPLNRNGKIDQQRLKELYLLRSLSTREPSNMVLSEKGEKLVEIWKQTTDGSTFLSFDLNSNFFELGGHSLSVLKLQSKIKEELTVELTFDQLYRYSIFADQLALIEEKTGSQEDVIQNVRESQDAKVSVYCIHAIGGTIYSYFSMATIWPADCNIYAIGYNQSHPAQTLKQLAEFYYKQIMKHAKDRPFFLLGHSLGGIVSWEIAGICLKNKQSVPIVCAFDSWVVDNDKLDEQEVLKYLQSRFSSLERRSELINAALQLCQMLKSHRMEHKPVPLILFKAEHLGETALKHVIRKDLTDEMVSAKMDNGWMEYVDELSVYPCNSDHDSIMEPTTLSEYLWLFEQLIDQTK